MNTQQAMKKAKRRKQVGREYARWKRNSDAIDYSAKKAGMPRHLFLMGVALGTHRIEQPK